MQISWVELAIGSASVWRITHLIHAEDGPWDALVRMRRLAGDGMWGKMLDCFYCASVWAAAPVAALLGADWMERLLLWPALSGVAILIERVTARAHSNVPMAQWHREPEEEVVQGQVLKGEVS